jgi:multicomponent Na+:H+ antiporter subunit C
MTGIIPYITVAALIGIALYILMFKKNLIKMVMALTIMASGANLLLVALGYRVGGVAPIYTFLPQSLVVLPVPQALVLTSIVIAVAIQALMLSMLIHIYRHTGSIDSEESRRMKG